MKFDPKVPASLLEIQQWFGTIETRPFRKTGDFKLPLYDQKTISSIESRISSGPKLSPAQRIGIYNQQYWWRLFTLMQQSYPGLLRLFGYADFNHLLAEPYLIKYPPDFWSLNGLGSRLPQWIDEEYKDEDRILIYQIALIDEAHERLLHVCKYPIVESHERLFLQPDVILFDLDADLFSFRNLLLEQEPEHWENSDFPTIDWSNDKRYFTLHLFEEEFHYEEISKSEFLLLKAFENGSPIADACSLLNDDAASQISSWFQKWASQGWLGDRR